MAVFGLRPAGAAVELPLRTLGPNGSHGHWSVLARRRKSERRTAAALCPAHALPCVVRLTRLSAGELDDDNLRGALKGVRDGVADRLGVDDRDPRVRWEYGQAKCKRGEYGVLVEIMAANGPESTQEGDVAVGCGGPYRKQRTRLTGPHRAK
ncbi:MAG: hypothetical protein GX856_08670 [Gammaproteobacteria bacterium]|jgi:hypothetical protein|nr:hypothetical protein [Gammaproteobacteria bacterium]